MKEKRKHKFKACQQRNKKRAVAKPRHGKNKTISSNYLIISRSFVTISNYSPDYSSKIQKLFRKKKP